VTSVAAYTRAVRSETAGCLINFPGITLAGRTVFRTPSIPRLILASQKRTSPQSTLISDTDDCFLIVSTPQKTYKKP